MVLDLSINVLRIAKVISILGLVFAPPVASYAHLYGLNFQEWTNRGDDVLIQFQPQPQTPIAGKPSLLVFSVQDLKTKDHLQDFTEMLTITKQETFFSQAVTYRVEPQEIKNGDFSINYTFPSGGTYEIFMRIDTQTNIDVARFTVFVSSTPFQILNVVYLLLPVLLFIALLGVAIILIAKYVYKKK